MAQAALDDGVADLVEMTRAQIADPRLVGLVRHGQVADGPVPASSATRPARSATTATRWSAAWESPAAGTRPVEPPGGGTDRDRRARC